MSSLVGALDRLSGTRIRTNIKTGEQEVTDGFGLIDSWKIIRQTASGRMSELRINLSDWVFNAVVGREMLTLSRDYFRLRKPLERRIYELARKHCGQQDEWVISLELLKKKCGSASEDYEFRRLITIICNEDASHSHMPDYAVSFDGEQREIHQPQNDEGPPRPRTTLSFRCSTLRPITMPERSLLATMSTGWKWNGGIFGLKAASRN